MAGVPPRITLLTDFGTRDGYVAALRGVIAAIAPAAHVDDASHDIEPGNVRAAAHALDRYWRLYPPGTVHVVVVDPGVGTTRRGLALEAGGRAFVGPDNGVFGAVLDACHDARVREIRETTFLHQPVSATFHGRDVFAPVAAHLARGVPLDAVGPPVSDPVALERPRPEVLQGAVHGVVTLVDRFGNLITNIPEHMLPDGAVVHIARKSLPVVRTYGDAERGAVLALVGSTGFLEVAVRDGSAATSLGLGPGAEVAVRQGG